MINNFYNSLLTWIEQQPDFACWHGTLRTELEQILTARRWGDLPQWQAALDNLPSVTPSSVGLKNAVTIGCSSDLSAEQSQQLTSQLQQLHPWRKGPFQLFDTHIDTEWRSDWKWDRVKPHLADLKDRLVLDIGCGNGYHCLRMHGEGARRVIGIDPSIKFVYQFYAIKGYLPDIPVDVLPFGIELLPDKLDVFDTVLSMGVLYHRRSPIDHLRELKGLLRKGGQLVLETLIIEGGQNTVLVPEGRYAKMRNVWFIPSADALLLWLKKCGFVNPRMVDQNKTSTEEQRSTDWMRFESLQDFLDPDDPTKTFEGHPAPLRAVFIAEAPG